MQSTGVAIRAESEINVTGGNPVTAGVIYLRLPLIRRFLRLLAATLFAIAGCGPQQQSHIPMDARQVGGDADLNDILLKLLERHGVSASVDSDWIETSTGYRLAASVVREMPSPGGTVNLQLDFYVDLPDGRLLIESFAGLGTSKEEAINDGIQNYVSNSFHVILSSISAGANSDQVETEEWTINGRQRNVIIGGMGIRRFTDAEFDPPTEWFSTVQTEIERLPLDERRHWIRCYYAQMDGKPMAVEALLDNEESSTLLDVMKQIEWPPDSEYYGLRIFLVIQELGK